jgi:hypothetical protein
MIGARATASLVTLAGAIAAIVIGVRIVLRLPGIPYNVRGLFLDDASVPTLVFFALALMWFGGGAALGAFVVTSTRRGFLAFPVVMTALALIGKLLVSRSVTYESLDDVLGSVNLYGLVVQSGAWGPWWQDTFRTIGADTVDFVERRVRYCALYSIPVTPMVLAIIPTLRRRAVGLRDALLLLDRRPPGSCCAARLFCVGRRPTT